MSNAPGKGSKFKDIKEKTETSTITNKIFCFVFKLIWPKNTFFDTLRIVRY